MSCVVEDEVARHVLEDFLQNFLAIASFVGVYIGGDSFREFVDAGPIACDRAFRDCWEDTKYGFDLSVKAFVLCNLRCTIQNGLCVE